MPALAAGERYVCCAAGYYHTVLLKNTGEAVAFGEQEYGECAVPALVAGERYEEPRRRLAERRAALVARRTAETRLDVIVSAMAGAAFEDALFYCLQPCRVKTPEIFVNTQKTPDTTARRPSRSACRIACRKVSYALGTLFVVILLILAFHHFAIAEKN